MARQRRPHIGRPFNRPPTEAEMNDLFIAGDNAMSIRVTPPLLSESLPQGGIRIWLDPSAIPSEVTFQESIWPVVVREVRDDADHFLTVQDVERSETDPWDGLMQPVGEAYEMSIWGHGIARDFKALITRETSFTRSTPIITAVYALGQPWAMQYLRFDLIQPRERIRYTDCVSAFTEGR